MNRIKGGEASCSIAFNLPKISAAKRRRWGCHSFRNTRIFSNFVFTKLIKFKTT